MVKMTWIKLVLFIIAVIIPGGLFVFFSWVILEKKKELDKKVNILNVTEDVEDASGGDSDTRPEDDVGEFFIHRGN